MLKWGSCMSSNNKKIMIRTLLFSLGTAVFTCGSAGAAGVAATDTVLNSNTPGAPYSTITVNKTVSTNASFAVPQNETLIYQGVLSKNDVLTDMTVYLAGSRVVNVDGTGYDTTKDYGSGAAGFMNESSAHTLVVAADGPITIQANAQGGTYNGNLSAVKSAWVAGVYNADGGTIEVDQPLNITAMATGGTANCATSTNNATAHAQAMAYGVYNDSGTVITGAVNADVTAVGGTAIDADQAANAMAMTAGLFCVNTINGNVSISRAVATGGTASYHAVADASGLWGVQTVNGDVNVADVTAKGGITTSDDGNADSFARGFSGVSNVTGKVKIDNVIAIGGAATGPDGTASATATGMEQHNTGNMGAVEIDNIEAIAGSATVADAYAQGIYFGEVCPLTLASFQANVKAVGTTNDKAVSPSTYAYGIDISQGNVQINGDTSITAIISTTVASPKSSAYAVYTEDEENQVNINTTDGVTGMGGTVRLVGDILSYGNSRNNIVLDGSNSYLQGNVFNSRGGNEDKGINNIVVENGAVWRPVFDNRNGSFIDANDSSTWNLRNRVTNDSIAAITVKDGGVVDLTWDNALRADSFRTLSIDSLNGDNSVFRINSDLVNNKADRINLGEGSTTTTTSVDVKYDPYLITGNLEKGDFLTGRAVIFDGAGAAKLTTVYGVADTYNLCDYVPVVTKNDDGTWSLTALTITNVNIPSAAVRDAGHAAIVLNNLWRTAELNNLQKRMGDLRAVEPAASGIWARYEHNKVEHGDNAALSYNLFQAGYDKDYISTNGTTYRGAAISYAKGTGEYEIGSGDVKDVALSLYQTWIGKDGRYYDIILKGGKLMNKYDLTHTANYSNSDYHTWAYSVGGEYGKRIIHANGTYVEPQAELILGRINGADYTTSTGLHVDIDGQNTAIARVGVAVGREGKNGSYYAKASYYHDFGSGVRLSASVDGARTFDEEDNARNWCVFTLGGTIKGSNDFDIYGEISKYTGQLTNHLQYNVGARWKL